MAWNEHLEREVARYRDGEARLGEIGDPDVRQRQLTRMGNAAWGAGLSMLMAGDDAGAETWFDRAVDRYHESLEDAPPGSWGRYIGALKCRIFAGNWAGAEEEARRTLEADAPDAESPIGKYAAALAFLVLGADDDAGRLAEEIRAREDFPSAVGDSLAQLAGSNRTGYHEAVEAVLVSFEEREEYLEDIPVADTVLVLQALARRRSLAAELSSPLLPA